MAYVFATIEGIRDAQQKNLRRVAMLQPGKLTGRLSQYMAVHAHSYATEITHVQTGSLRASHRIDPDFASGRAAIYIDPGAVNPETGERPAVYGIEEHARGGDHAFYRRVVTERGRTILDKALKIAKQELGL
jgi:hypothetical protein